VGLNGDGNLGFYFTEYRQPIRDNDWNVIGYKEPYYGSDLGGLNFKTKEDVRKFLAGYGLIPTDVPKADMLKTTSRREIEEARKEREKTVPYKTKQEADSIMREIMRVKGIDLDSVPKKKTDKTSRAGDYDLFLTIDNVKNTGSKSDVFLEFDIMGRADKTVHIFHYFCA